MIKEKINKRRIIKNNFYSSNSDGGSGNDKPVILRKTPHEKVKIDITENGVVFQTHNIVENDLIEQGFLFNDDLSTGNLRMIHIDGANIFFNELTSSQSRVVNAEFNEPALQMYFLLEGENCLSVNKNKSLGTISENQHNVFFRPSFKGQYHLHGKKFQNFGIQLSEKFYNRLINPNSKVLNNFFEKIEKREFIKLASHNLVITPAMKAILYDIQNSKRTGYMKRLFLESKIIELFMLQVEQAESSNNGNSAKFKKEDIDKLHDARTYIEINMLEEFSLLELSRKIRLNDFKLKKGFKELFGTTVFGYLNELKMNYAKRLILDEKKTIFETSLILGYSEPHHFSAAFKRRFGYSPGELK